MNFRKINFRIIEFGEYSGGPAIILLQQKSH